MTLTDDFTDDLTSRLRARRDELGAAATMPAVADLLQRADASRQDGAAVLTLPRRRTGLATALLAVAAVGLLLIGVLVLTRRDQRVSTLPASPAQRLIDAGVPLLFPPIDDADVSARLPADDLPIPTDVNATVETYARGKVGETASFVTLVAVDAGDPDSVGVFGSLRPSKTFDPTSWFADPASASSVAPTPTDGGYDLVHLPLEGADRAVLADSPDRADILAVQRYGIDLALVGVGTTPDELIELAVHLDWGGGGVSLMTGDSGFTPLVPRATTSATSASVEVSWDTGGLTATPADQAAWIAAISLSNTGAALPVRHVLRAGPAWVFSGPDDRTDAAGVRDGAWVDVSVNKKNPRFGTNPLNLFDELRLVDSATFDRAVDRGDRRADASTLAGNDRMAADVKKWGGWIPTPAAGQALIGLNQTGSAPPMVGGMTGLRPLWNPTTGATIWFSDYVQPWSTEAAPDDLVESTTIGGRAVEIRSWPGAPDDLHAVLTDQDGHRVMVTTTAIVTAGVRDIVAGLTEHDDRTWTMTIPAGFEPLPFAHAIDAEVGRSADYHGAPNDINGTLFTLGRPGQSTAPSGPAGVPPGVMVDVSKVDPDIYGDIAAQFFQGSPVERMSTAGQTWYRVRTTSTYHQILLPGTANRPMITVRSAERTDDELFDIATTVRPAGDDEVEALIAGYSGP